MSGECKDKEIPDSNKGGEEGGRDWGASEAREERGDKREKAENKRNGGVQIERSRRTYS